MAATISAGLSSAVPPADLQALAATDTLIVLGGDNVVARATEAARIYRTAKPQIVFISGDQWLVDRVLEDGVPPSVVRHEWASRNTREQIMWVRRVLAERPQARAAIIVSRLQMPRVAGLLRDAGIEMTIVPSPLDIEPATRGLRRFLPTYAALRESRDSMYEHVALAYYREQGWIGGATTR